MDEFQKLHNEMKALKKTRNHAEFAKRFAAKSNTFMGPLHEPISADKFGSLAETDKLKALAEADIDVKLDEITQIGDVVIDRSTVNIKCPSGGEKTGWNLTVWIKEDGQWKIRNSCTTFKMPANA
ncbi:unnamed protein product [Caenorhabditis bovis]|uniref:DUF4440 domain-containing protein n=1 Tax=Caenorhabditis bovis TaxID=2654633 RepID=A0A8S1EYR5_9PELO|nr:unnamed protein product [Caenorhabditis bovis]